MSRPKMLYNRQGFALEATLFVLLLLAVLCVFAVSGVTTTTRTANYDYRNTRTVYAAEAAADDIMQQLSGMVDDGFISQTELDSLTRPTVPGFDIPTMLVVPNGGATQETINEPPFAGLFALVRNYDITTRAADSMGNASRAVVTVKAAAIPIFQFGVFYEKDLEITNGQRLDMQGWVHTNGNIYVRSGGGLYLHNIVTTPNKFFFRRKDGAIGGADQVYIDDAGGTARQMNNDSEGLPLASDFSSWSETRFSGRLKTDAYGVDTLRLPLPLSVPPEELIADREIPDTPEERETKFAWKADLYMSIDYTRIDNTLCATLGSTDIQYIRAGGRTSPTTAECDLIFVADSNKWWESREQTFVDEITIDYARLFTWMAANGTNPSSIMYITVRNVPLVAESYATTRGCLTGCTFRPYPVIKIVNASVLGRPFTLASNLPIYVQGDYNSTVNWQPSAIIGDAFTWLSGTFPTTGTILNRPAGAGVNIGGVTRWVHPPVAAAAGTTTFYAAVLAGHGATPFDWMAAGVTPPGCNYTGTGSQAYFYGGGLENFPRFLENWGGRTAFYRGSLVSIAYAQKASNFCGWAGAYYGVPTRNWAFDTRFQDPANLPPGTPVVGSVVQTAYRPVYE